MPKFPSYDSQRQINSNLSAPIRQSEAERATAITGPIQEAATQINTKWNQAVDSMQETSVKLSYETAQSQIENDAINDTDINGEEKQTARLKKASEQALKGVTNKYLQSQLKFQLDHANTVAGIKIKDVYNKKKVIADNVNTEALLQTYATQGVEGDEKASALIQTKIAASFYDEKEGKKLLDNTRKTAVGLDIANDMATSLGQSLVYSELKKGSKGEYRNLSPDVLASSLDDIQKKVRRNQILNVFNIGQNQDKNEAQYLVEKNNGTLTSQKIKQGILSQEIRKGFGEKLLSNFGNAPAQETKKSIYNKAMEMGLQGASTAEINDFIVGNSDQVKPEDIQGVLEMASVIKDKKSAERFKYNADALRVWAVKNMGSPELAEDIVYDFFQRVHQDKAQGDQVDAIANEIVKTTIKKEHPETALMSDIPNFIADRKRIKRVNAKASKLKGSPIQSAPLPVSAGLSFDEL